MQFVQQARLTRDQAVWVLATLCQLHRIPFDPTLFLDRHPVGRNGDYGLVDLLLATEALGLAASLIDHREAVDLTHATRSAIAFVLRPAGNEREARSASESAKNAWTPVLVAPASGGQVIWTEYAARAPVTRPWSEVAPTLRGEMYSFAPAPERLRDEDGVREQADKPFGFAWFVPELLRYRTVWRDILGASLALQLVGLATPLFTQVVIDKVVVHQSHSTLAAATVGLALAIVFSAIFSWVRQYLVLHTGNRVDAVLGSRVFAHLLKLPMPYFYRRPTGTLVARLHGVEAIREFLAGAAVALVLDLPFMVVLLCVMWWYSWQLTLVALGLVLVLALLSVAVTPLFRARLNRQFLLGARNQAFVTEYVCGMETVKSLQLEPQLLQRYGAYLADSVAAGFDTRQVSNSYQTAANSLEQLQGLAVLVI
ncbi:ABC transporter transmembrane domain-containing protein, partial [Ramlibacter sp.]|uniref:ABC transporter transmembrane domain-containing protein n=1 Tax=Ramlibacter sp. TaxID=1917967 RepID=UPI002B5E35DC